MSTPNPATDPIIPAPPRRHCPDCGRGVDAPFILAANAWGHRYLTWTCPGCAHMWIEVKGVADPGPAAADPLPPPGGGYAVPPMTAEQLDKALTEPVLYGELFPLFRAAGGVTPWAHRERHPPDPPPGEDPRLVCPGCGKRGEFTGLENESSRHAHCVCGVQWRAARRAAAHRPLATCPGCGKAGGQAVAGASWVGPDGVVRRSTDYRCCVCQTPWTDPPDAPVNPLTRAIDGPERTARGG